MVASTIAFEAPVTERSLFAARARPVDLVHLAGRSLGDANLEAEALQMFVRQARNALREMGKGDPALTAAAARRLRQAASAVGAFQVAETAGCVEANAVDAGGLAKLGAELLEAENFILKLCR
ncbi:Hpt domain-containing protein [Rhizobium halophilum]|uniref:Hpt domain-containing protein n=1 Tax=Rhizobium halophilum TaxID=2846852 RepID=UPI001EFE51C5|nr:Hpt domain-containing protein [Rhizobium halophilum]MCF6368438.1 Hpt domain-containing protein [Rhizobium halophilum]